MANATKRLPQNTAGSFFVDDTCIDCGACRWIAPETFNRDDSIELSRVYRQPVGEAEIDATIIALVSCPTASIGAESAKEAGIDLKRSAELLPQRIKEDLYFCGYTSESSFGAASWLLIRRSGNILIDSPRFAGPLVKRFEELGGISEMWLTHKDDVADHRKFAAHFGCKRVMHHDDVNATCNDVEVLLEGEETVDLGKGLLAIPTPGHTKGSVCYLADEKYLFTGDHLAWSRRYGHLIGFRTACWYSWPKLVESMKRLQSYRFERVLPGHGSPFVAGSAEAMAAEMQRCVEWCAGA